MIAFHILNLTLSTQKCNLDKDTIAHKPQSKLKAKRLKCTTEKETTLPQPQRKDYNGYGQFIRLVFLQQPWHADFDIEIVRST